MLNCLKTLGTFSLCLLLAACGSSSSQTADSSPQTVDIQTRLNEQGSFDWTEDRFSAITDTKVQHIYFGGGCAVWVFPNYSDVESADKSGQFGFYKGEVWYGQDDLSEKGVALLTDSKETSCAKVVFKVLNWSTDQSDPAATASSMEGKWGSFSWMQDQVGSFLIVKSLGGSDYEGTFYTQGQNGSVNKDISIQISDSGDGLAEVTWPSGTVNTATWGKRDANTSKKMSATWNGDIWFDCIGELDFAQSRADCDFYLSK
jgi:hypothetical protein